MTKITAYEFRNLCDSVVYALDSVSSCRPIEMERETRRVLRTSEELRGAVLARKNADCESYRAMVLRRVDDLVAGQAAHEQAKGLSDQDVIDRLAKIREAAQQNDFEVAHSLEDQLRADVLLAVALGHPDSAQLARRALVSDAFAFGRHCA